MWMRSKQERNKGEKTEKFKKGEKTEKFKRVKERQEDKTCSGNSLNEGADVRIKLQNLIYDLQDKSSPPFIFLQLSCTN